MGDRVVRTARSLGVSDSDLSAIGEAHMEGMERRGRELHDDHDPRFLHPGRTALVLLEDGGVVDPESIVTALLVDTWDPGLAPDLELVEGRFGARVADRVRGVPAQRGREPDRLLEDLLMLDRPDAVLALAERLDHLRHAHLDPDLGERERLYRLGCGAYQPAAHHLGHPDLIRRYDYWCRTFPQRFLQEAQGSP
jgi:(p)ppGpp synthase/HD superfamily hydrolase